MKSKYCPEVKSDGPQAATEITRPRLPAGAALREMRGRFLRFFERRLPPLQQFEIWEERLRDPVGLLNGFANDPQYRPMQLRIIAQLERRIKQCPEKPGEGELRRYANPARKLVAFLRMRRDFVSAETIASSMVGRAQAAENASVRSIFVNEVGLMQSDLGNAIIDHRGAVAPELERHARIIDFRTAHEPAVAGTPTFLVGFKLLRAGYATSLSAMDVADADCSRNARNCALNAGLHLLTAQFEYAQDTPLIRASMRSFINEMLERISSIPWNADDDIFVFAEAPLLAFLDRVARMMGMDINLFENVSRERFEDALRILYQEYAEWQVSAPQGYGRTLVEKIEAVEKLLGR